MGAGVIALFAGYPIISALTTGSLSTNGAFNLGGINSTGQVPDIPGMPRMIDPDTPDSVFTRTGFDGNDDWELVFSDEFNEDGRTFYEGDDPFWQGESWRARTVRAVRALSSLGNRAWVHLHLSSKDQGSGETDAS